MRLYRFISEGLIKIPDKLYKELLNITYSQYISYIEKNIQPSESKDILIGTLIQTYKINKHQKFNKFTNEPIKVDFKIDDVPVEFKGFWKENQKELLYVINWEQLKWADRPKVGGAYSDKDFKITINPRLLIDLVKSQSTEIRDYVAAFDKPKYTLWHEMTHLVQKRAIANIDPSQVAKLTSGGESQEERKTPEYREKYLQNMIEFDPMLKTAVYKFNSNYKHKIKNISDFKKCFNDFTLAADLEKDNDFFTVLFRKDIKRWKKAIKYLWIYLTENDFRTFKN